MAEPKERPTRRNLSLNLPSSSTSTSRASYAVHVHADTDPHLNRSVALITGASSGIGEALARVFAQRGYDLVLGARRIDRLEALAKELEHSCHICCGVQSCDVMRTEDLDALAQAARDRFGRIDIVVANAGYSAQGRMDQFSEEEIQRQLEVNVMGVVRTIRATKDDLIASQGRLAIMGSVNSFVSVASTGVYAMSKHAVKALADALWYEMHPQGVSVTHLAPGFVASEIRGIGRNGEPASGHRRNPPAWMVMSTETAARKMVNAIESRRRERILTTFGHFIISVERHARWLLARIIRRFKLTKPGASY